MFKASSNLIHFKINNSFMVKAFELNVHHLSPVRLRKASKHGWAKKVKMSLLTITMNLFKYAYSIQTVPRRPNQMQNLGI